MKLQVLPPASPPNDTGVEHVASSLNRASSVLVADDDPNLRRLIAAVLTGAGFEVRTVSDGEQAWEAVCREPYDLLVTDNEMPRLSGLNLIQRMRAVGLHLPVLIASGTLSAESAHDVPQLQIAAVLIKPFRIAELLDAVNAFRLWPYGDATASPAACSQLHTNLQPTR